MHTGEALEGRVATPSCGSVRSSTARQGENLAPQIGPQDALPTSGRTAAKAHRLHELAHEGDAVAPAHQGVSNPASDVGRNRHGEPRQDGVYA